MLCEAWILEPGRVCLSLSLLLALSAAVPFTQIKKKNLFKKMKANCLVGAGIVGQRIKLLAATPVPYMSTSSNADCSTFDPDIWGVNQGVKALSVSLSLFCLHGSVIILFKSINL